ncbi:MAG: hypothetical protein K0S28_538 [Paucimonas sp.]|nr:hypothetical protein [Paucimonas sp.]
MSYAFIALKALMICVALASSPLSLAQQAGNASVKPSAASPPAGVVNPFRKPTVEPKLSQSERGSPQTEELHRLAGQLRQRSADLSSWQKRHWPASRVCHGSVISRVKKPKGKTAVLYDCSPFLCTMDALCRQDCASDADCSTGARCIDKDEAGRNGVCLSPD